ncbi:hypothetical protein VP01_1497g2 [Puccinia sorghi]|uniref:Uncharacterized protein n=1 Tax=Puccinia sorghi TaxID=27349 RepID=A0A0L6VKZ6_9BASI|nr:hypothetical protein VP01_1497g2 [Puccinia sorghi]
MISCTIALGLRKNWKQVHGVIHMDPGDPLCILQMTGQCAQDRKPVDKGLDDTMIYGYIPTNRDDANYLREEISEEEDKMRILYIDNFDVKLEDPERLGDACIILASSNAYFANQYGTTPSFLPDELFSYVEENLIGLNLDNLKESEGFGTLIGGEC